MALEGEFEGFEDLSNEPLEVRLVSETSQCRSCDWFWRPPPYGPYPSFDFTTDFPEVLRERTSELFRDGDYARSIPGKSRTQAIVNPQVLHGCRKAPIMTIGINPNLTGFWPGANGARWAYPTFSNFRRYAYYYRHRTTHQESFSLAFIRKCIRTDGALTTNQAGYVKSVRRDMAARKMALTLVYDDGSQEESIHTWDELNHFVLLLDQQEPFAAGDLIAGYINLPDEKEIPVQQNVVGYYQRVIPILEQVSAWLRSQGYLPNLQMAEDVCQLDMVACASPGWGKVYEIDKDEVTQLCIQKNAWVIKQLVQSRPKVIVFSGRSAFQLFNRIFKPFITPNLADNFEVYGLMQMTARDPHYLDIRTNIEGVEYSLRSRLIIAPHFSYDDNFAPHSRLSQAALGDFSLRFSDAFSELVDADRVGVPNRDGYVGIRTAGLGDWVTKYPIAAIPLMQGIYDASALVGQGISQEVMLGNLRFDEKTNHLERSPGPCQFCVNDIWSFPEGCNYDKPKEPALPHSFLDRTVEEVMARLSDGA